MRKVELRMNEQEKYEVIKELVDHNGNKNRASKKLGISRRQIDRLIIKYKENGKSAFIHGNRSKKPANALDNSISEDIILLYKTKYYDFNFCHFNEFLKKDENIDVDRLDGQNISAVRVSASEENHCYGFSENQHEHKNRQNQDGDVLLRHP